MAFNFNYTSAVPQLDRQMVFGGYAGIDPNTSGSTNALNNLNNVDFWSNPWDTQLDLDGFTGFNDPSFGLNTGTNLPGGGNQEGSRRGSSLTQFGSLATQSRGMGGLNSSAGGGGSGFGGTAFFMPFNIEPPSSSQFGNTSGNVTGGGGGSFDEFSGLDSMMDMGSFSFSPGLSGEGGDENRQGSSR